MQPSEEEILASLAHYRASVLQRNHAAFQRFVQHAETAEPESGGGEWSPSDIFEARQEFIYRLLNVSQPENLDPSVQINVPADVVTKWDALVRAFALDGVYIGNNAQRAAYKGGIEAGLGRVSVEVEFPADFDVLMGQVGSLQGHGWPQYHEEDQQVHFWNGLGESVDEVADRVYGPDDDLASKAGLDDWEVKAGWECGQGPETTCFIVYCRQEETGKGWAWRYVAEMGQYGEEVFDNVVELLQWYETLYIPPLDDQLDVFMGEVFKN
ncbi:hypothetical protein F4819DRAFT_464935 [Hypoxylon fuscum]|nr:hypothetical protein F4819DRAFT_464935 [Hypoxylon fuscum]